MSRVIRDKRPQWCYRNIFGVHQCRSISGPLVDQECCFPNSKQRVLPFVLKVAMHVNIRIGEELNINGYQKVGI